MSMHPVHKFAFVIYNLGWSMAIPWLKLNHRLAAGYPERVLRVSTPAEADLWIQAASVGEAFLALEVVKNLNVMDPIRILVTTNTSQGLDILNRELDKAPPGNKPIQTAVHYFPFDKPSIMKQAVDRIRPKLTVLLETELWPGMLCALKNYGSKLMIVNGRMTAKSLKRYLLWPSIWSMLSPDRILAISAQDADHFRRLFGNIQIDIMPNIKFDRVPPVPSQQFAGNPLIRLLPPDATFIVLASVRQQEEPFVKKIIARVLRHEPKCILGLFPRHIHRIKFWQRTLTKLNIKWVLRSRVDSAVSLETVVLWDIFGELLPAYRLAKAAFVGGSLAPLGGQNFLEPLVSGVIPVIGPSWENFAWVGTEILQSGLLRVANDWNAVARLLLENLEHPPRYEEVIRRTNAYIKRHQGGARQACRQIENLLQSR